MKIFINCLIALVFIIVPVYPFAYDRATYGAQNGQWKDAHEALNSILVNAPDSADVLYDAGVAAYNLKNYSQAAVYFSRAAECAPDNALKIRAYFNAGNASVADKKLAAALNQYNNVLDLDKTHEYARHNYDRVKQMIEDQKKEEEQQQKEQEQQQQDKQDKENDDQGNEQQDHNNDDQNDGDENESNNKKSQGKQTDKTESGGNDTQGQEHRDKKKDQKQSADNQKRDSDQKSQEKSRDKENKNDIKHGDKHAETPAKKSHNSDGASVTSEGGQEQDKISNNMQAVSERQAQREAQEESWAQENPWLLEVLNDQERRDKEINKQLMEAKIHQHGGKNGQNCW